MPTKVSGKAFKKAGKDKTWPKVTVFSFGPLQQVVDHIELLNQTDVHLLLLGELAKTTNPPASNKDAGWIIFLKNSPSQGYLTMSEKDYAYADKPPYFLIVVLLFENMKT